MQIEYSEQAKAMLTNMPAFDKEDFEKWFFDNLVVGSNNILMYLMDKREKKNGT